MNELVSIVITTYKRRVSQISKAIYSVLNQTYQNIELIIVDDSPNSYKYRNEVATFCKGLNDNRAKYVQHKTNMGACAARNTGLKLASGKYIAFLDDDDEYLPDRIEKGIKLFNDSVNLVFNNSNVIRVGEKKLQKAFDRSTQYRGNVYEQILGNNFIGSTSVAILKRNALIEIGGFDPEMEASQDWDVWIRICKHGEVNYSDDALINYYIYPGERITNDTERRLRALLHLNEKNRDDLNKYKNAKALRKIYEMRLRAINNDFKGAVKNYIQLIRIRPKKILSNIIAAKSFARLLIKKENA